MIEPPPNPDRRSDGPATPAQVEVARLILAAMRDAEREAIRSGLDILVSGIRQAILEAENVIARARSA